MTMCLQPIARLWHFSLLTVLMVYCISGHCVPCELLWPSVQLWLTQNMLAAEHNLFIGTCLSGVFGWTFTKIHSMYPIHNVPFSSIMDIICLLGCRILCNIAHCCAVNSSMNTISFITKLYAYGQLHIQSKLSMHIISFIIMFYPFGQFACLVNFVKKDKMKIMHCCNLIIVLENLGINRRNNKNFKYFNKIHAKNPRKSKKSKLNFIFGFKV